MFKKIIYSLAIIIFSSVALADCPDVKIFCYSYDVDRITPIPNTSHGFTSGSTWDWKNLGCNLVRNKTYFINQCMNIDKNLHSVVYPKGPFRTIPDYALYHVPGVNTENWMKALKERYPAFSKAAIKDIIIPGTHNSGSYALNQNSDYSPDESIDSLILEFLKTLDVTKAIYADWAKSQPHDVYQQLTKGIRYIDLRVCGKSGEPYSCHGMYSDKLSNIIQQINRFISKEENRYEIIILDINHIYQMSDGAQESLISHLLSTFGDKIASRDAYGLDSTLHDFWENNKQLIIVYQNKNHTAHHPELWPSSSVDSFWPNTSKANELISQLNSRLLRRTKNNAFNVIQTQVTADRENITDGLYNPLAAKSIHDNTLTYKQKIYDWLYDNKDRIKPFGNILIEDWAIDKSLVHYAITLNSEKFS